MEKIMDKIIERAKKNSKIIVLPEAEDERVLKATEKITKDKIAEIILVGNKKNIGKKAKELNIDLSSVQIVSPREDEYFEEYVKYLYDLRKEKGLTLEKAYELVLDPVYFGVLMVKLGRADGLVSGAIHSTADTLRPALQIIKAKASSSIVSSFFLMEFEKSRYENEYIFSDCGLIPNPNKEELAQIAIDASETYKLLIEKEPRVAMLSYSTMGSAKSELVQKVIDAKDIVLHKRKDILIDGELQLDAAIDASVAKQKAPNSSVAGDANVLVFPNLDAGNIGYKLAERFGGANAYGPITQGLAKPINDLSRGCKTEDIVGAVAITSLQANEIN